MDQDDRDQANKQPSDHQDHAHHQQHRRVPLTRLRQLGSDFVQARVLQVQERPFTTLETIESESDSNGSMAEESSHDDDDYDEEDYEFFEDSGLELDLGFLDQDEDEDEDEDMEEVDDDDDDGLDVDELTYEELIALGEFIGVEKRGLSLNEISSCFHPIVWKTTSSSSSVDHGNNMMMIKINGVDRCAICQVEYEDGEELVGLTPCEHPYHSECISKWLQIKKCCPICSTEVMISSSPASTHNNTNK